MTFKPRKPQPDVREFKEIILKRKVSKQVRFAELHLDVEVVRYIVEYVLGKKWVDPVSGNRDSQAALLKNHIDSWHSLGYDCLRLSNYFRFNSGLSFKTHHRVGQDTADLSRGQRSWTEEGKGVITSWEDFEKYPWPDPSKSDLWPFEYTAKNLPEGMGIFACPCQGFLEMISNELMGYETLCYMLYDDPKLVEAVINKAGELILQWYRRIVGLENVVAFFQGDDMGFKSSTLLAPENLKKYILPWHKKLAELAHQNGLIYILHSCGNVIPIMDDLIDDVKIDAKHSFEDAIVPVVDFKKKYGDRVAVIGGVDVDKLCRFSEQELRSYVREILSQCMPQGGYLLGSGNSIANYIPIENYFAMLEEGYRWNG